MSVELHEPIAGIAPAAYTRVEACSNGCPVIVLKDVHLRPVAVAHLSIDWLEEFIAELREAAAIGAARARPVV